MGNLSQLANADRNLSLFCQGLKIAQLDNLLKETDNYTILAPVNLALRTMDIFSGDEFRMSEKKAELTGIISDYIFRQKMMFGNLFDNQQLTAISGRTMRVSIYNEETIINGAKILVRNRQASNGVIHLLNKVWQDTNTK